MRRPTHRKHSLFDLKVSTSSNKKRPRRPSFRLQDHTKLFTTPKQHSNDPSWDLSVRESLRRKAQKEVDTIEIKKNVTKHAPVSNFPPPAPLTTLPRIAPSSRPTTFFTAPATSVPILFPPVPRPSLQPVVRTTPTLVSFTDSPIPTPLSPPSQEASNALFPDTARPTVAKHGPVTLLIVLGAAVASLLLSLLILRARHRYVQKHGAARTRRRQRQSTWKVENAVSAGTEIQGSTVETREAVDLEDESL
jgi:hypothetical protein